MKKVILLSLSILLISLAYSFAEVPCKINYQGRLIKDNVPVDGQVNMEFKLYTQLTGGTLKKTISMSNVPVYNGLFRAVLDLEGIDWAAGETMYLEVKVGADILTPREELYAYPYAINSHLLEGETKNYFLNTSGDSQTKQGNLNIMGNVGIGTTSPGQKLTVTGTIESTTGGVKFPDGTLQTTAGGGGFGVWNDRNKDGNPDTVANNTVYKAATDGFVCAFTTTIKEINGYTDSSSSPTTVRQFFTYGASISFPVRKGDYWKVTGATKVYWLPLGF